MTAYTLISSRDPIDGDQLVYELARNLAKAGNPVTLFLVENGTFLARKGAAGSLLGSLADAGVKVLADDLSLAERGIVDGALASAVSATKLDTLVDHLAAGHKVSWH